MPSKPTADSMAVPTIILAAGASRRLGQAKQLLRLPAFAGETLLDHAVALAQKAHSAPIFVVLGAHADEIRLGCELLDCILVLNEAWTEGMASSLHAGISAVLEHAPAATSAMVMVCDQPGLSVEHLRHLLAAHQSDRNGIVASRYAGRAGVPAIFPRASFPALMALRGDQGARVLLQQPEASVCAIDFPGGELDLDSQGDLKSLDTNRWTRPSAKTS